MKVTKTNKKALEMHVKLTSEDASDILNALDQFIATKSDVYPLSSIDMALISEELAKALTKIRN